MSDLKKEIDGRVEFLDHLVTNEMAMGGGKPMNGEMLLVFEALQELYERLDKLERPGK